VTDPIIRVEHLGKRYRIGQKETPPETMRELALALLGSPFRYMRQMSRPATEAETLWALRNVSFDVRRGEVLGIVGRNGAGKSTLLKILSRITEPTEGRAFVRGRLGSLLEVGTGFHPELSGRENVYLNGAILGMRRREIARKFDAIVAFGEVEKFIDTPVKRYSSGMYVRLAFSVAIHLEPDILVVDEVLAVGDLAFQQKCLSQLRNLMISGKTILLVSHNLPVIQSSCTRAVLLEAGAIVGSGEPLAVIDSYRDLLRRNNQEPNGRAPQSLPSAPESGAVSIVGFDMLGEDGASRRDFKFGEAIRIRIDLYARQRVDHPLINFGVRRGDGVVICNFNNWYDNFKVDYIEGECTLEGWLPPLRLIPDYYEAHVLVWLWGGGHVPGDLRRSRPLSWKVFGDFRIHGPGFNSHDGVFQIPARKWRFSRGLHTAEQDIAPDAELEPAVSAGAEGAHGDRGHHDHR
jgi:lipopolysaccharide transport system ATP-binding protein